ARELICQIELTPHAARYVRNTLIGLGLVELCTDQHVRFWHKADIIGLSDPVDARGVTPRRGEMDVQVLCFRIRELARYRSFDVTAFDDLPARHHSRGIKAAYGECAFSKLLRHLPDGIERFLAAANVDCKPHTIR